MLTPAVMKVEEGVAGAAFIFWGIALSAFWFFVCVALIKVYPQRKHLFVAITPLPVAISIGLCVALVDRIFEERASRSRAIER